MQKITALLFVLFATSFAAECELDIVKTWDAVVANLERGAHSCSDKWNQPLHQLLVPIIEKILETKDITMEDVNKYLPPAHDLLFESDGDCHLTELLHQIEEWRDTSKSSAFINSVITKYTFNTDKFRTNLNNAISAGKACEAEKLGDACGNMIYALFNHFVISK